MNHLVSPLFIKTAFDSDGVIVCAFARFVRIVYNIIRKIVADHDITKDTFKSAVDTVKVGATFSDVKTGDTFELYVEGVDKYGFIHRSAAKKIDDIKEGTTETVTAIEDNETILDKDGNILYGEK